MNRESTSARNACHWMGSIGSVRVSSSGSDVPGVRTVEVALHVMVDHSGLERRGRLGGAAPRDDGQQEKKGAFHPGIGAGVSRPGPRSGDVRKDCR
jgi:hypothetical protein